MSKIDKFKPFFTERGKSIVFDRFENEIKHRPIIIFYDDFLDCYYYLKLRTATISKPNGIALKKKTPGEILVKKSTQKGSLLKNDSYIDTTQIFKINSEELEKIVNTQDILYLNTYYFQWDIVRTILLEVEKNLSYEPPKVSVVEVQKEGENYKGRTLYCRKDLWLYDKNDLLSKKITEEELDRINSLEKEIILKRNYDKDINWELNQLKLGVNEELIDFNQINSNETSEQIIETEEESLEQESEEDFGMTM